MSDIVNNLEASTGAGFVILEGGSCLDLVCVCQGLPFLLEWELLCQR